MFADEVTIISGFMFSKIMEHPLGVKNEYISKTKYGLCKNYGCPGKRADGSAFCQRCSERHNKLINNINNMEPDAIDVLHDFRKEIDKTIKTAEYLKGGASKSTLTCDRFLASGCHGRETYDPQYLLFMGIS
jgi:hypothetical protein